MYKIIKSLNHDAKLNNKEEGEMIITNLADFDAFNPNVRFFSLIHLKPGEEVKYHTHEGESETYFFLSGKGIYNDNGNDVEAVSGMVALTSSGEGHSLKNTGNEMLVFIALIILD